MTWLFVLRHWKALLCGIAVVSLTATAGYYRIDRDHWRAVAKTLRIDLDRVKVATDLADQKARAAKLAQEAEYRRKADEADDLYESRLAAANQRAADYARRMRVKAPAGASGQPIAAPNGSDAEGADGQGEDAFVAISRADFDAATENALRLQAAHEWACQQEGAKCD